MSENINKNKRDKYLLYQLILFFILIISVGCEKVILAGKGEIVTQKETFNSLSKISFHDIFEVELITDSIFIVEMIAHEKYLEKISFSLDSGNIQFYDKNPEKWMPEYPYPLLRISLPQLTDQLFLAAPVRISTPDTLQLPYLNILSLGKTGEIDISMDTEYFKFTTGSDNSGFYRFSGTARAAQLWLRGSSIIHAAALISEQCNVNNNSIGNCTVNVANYLEVRLSSSGNIFYHGNPGEIVVKEESDNGKLISLDH